MESVSDETGVGVMIEAPPMHDDARRGEAELHHAPSSVLGVFRDHLATREEFLSLVARNCTLKKW
jgi:GTP cyclohydrolase I